MGSSASPGIDTGQLLVSPPKDTGKVGYMELPKFRSEVLPAGFEPRTPQSRFLYSPLRHERRCSVVVSTPAWHAAVRGSIHARTRLVRLRTWLSKTSGETLKAVGLLLRLYPFGD